MKWVLFPKGSPPGMLIAGELASSRFGTYDNVPVKLKNGRKGPKIMMKIVITSQSHAGTRNMNEHKLKCKMLWGDISHPHANTVSVPGVCRW